MRTQVQAAWEKPNTHVLAKPFEKNLSKAEVRGDIDAFPIDT